MRPLIGTSLASRTVTSVKLSSLFDQYHPDCSPQPRRLHQRLVVRRIQERLGELEMELAVDPAHGPNGRGLKILVQVLHHRLQCLPQLGIFCKEQIFEADPIRVETESLQYLPELRDVQPSPPVCRQSPLVQESGSQESWAWGDLCKALLTVT